MVDFPASHVSFRERIDTAMTWDVGGWSSILHLNTASRSNTYHSIPSPILHLFRTSKLTYPSTGGVCWNSEASTVLGGGNSNIFFYVHREIWGRFSPILTSIFFKWVETQGLGSKH